MEYNASDHLQANVWTGELGFGFNSINESAIIDQLISQFSDNQLHYKELRYIVLIACYVPLIVIAAAANILVIVVVFKFHYMRRESLTRNGTCGEASLSRIYGLGSFSVTNYFLVNLSVADLLVTFICMPMAIGQSVSGLWLYGEAMCKLTSYLQGVSVGASVFTITAMSIDRYIAIRHSLTFRKIFNRKSTICVIICLWVISLAIFAPVLWVRQTAFVELGDDPLLSAAVERYGLAFCIEDWSTRFKHVYGVLCFVVVYFTPGCVVILAYTLMGRRLWVIRPPFDAEDGSVSTQQVRIVRERRRIARILLVLAVLFALCWLPYNLLALILDLDLSLHTFGLHHDRLMKAYPFTLLLGHANSAMNPMLYCFMTRNFRRTVRNMLCHEGLPRPRPRQRIKKRSATTSSGYASYHSPHRRCYVLTNLQQRTTGTRVPPTSFL